MPIINVITCLSYMLVAAGLLDQKVIFYGCVVINFMLMHWLWIGQLVKGCSWEAIDFKPFKKALLIFGAGGIIGFALLDLLHT